MQHNPYTPPASKEISFLREVVPRPISVWVLLAFLCAGSAFFTFAVAKFLLIAISHRSEIHNVAGLAIATVWRLALVAGLVATMASIYQRRGWSRWLGVVLIIGFAALSLLSPDSTDYANEAQRAGGFFGKYIFIPLIFGWWAYAFGFSSKAKRYFSKDAS